MRKTAIKCIYLLIIAASSPYLCGIERSTVQGIEVLHHNQVYTLNFEQQNALIDALNQSHSFNDPILNNDDTLIDIQKIIIYPFNSEKIEVMLLGSSKQNLIFSSTEWNGGAPIIEESNGSLNLMLSNTYDP